MTGVKVSVLDASAFDLGVNITGVFTRDTSLFVLESITGIFGVLIGNGNEGKTVRGRYGAALMWKSGRLVRGVESHDDSSVIDRWRGFLGGDKLSIPMIISACHHKQYHEKRITITYHQ